MQQDRRKNRRTDLDSKLVIKRLDGDSRNEVTINITDVSKQGVGFECREPLQIGEVYEAYLTIWTKEVIHAFLQIVRIACGCLRIRRYLYRNAGDGFCENRGLSDRQ